MDAFGYWTGSTSETTLDRWFGAGRKLPPHSFSGKKLGLGQPAHGCKVGHRYKLFILFIFFFLLLITDDIICHTFTQVLLMFGLKYYIQLHPFRKIFKLAQIHLIFMLFLLLLLAVLFATHSLKKVGPSSSHIVWIKILCSTFTIIPLFVCLRYFE